jgi:hypothetical protein
MSNGNDVSNVPAGRGASSPHKAVMFRLTVAGFLGGLIAPMLHPLNAFLVSHQVPSDFTVGYFLFSLGLGVVGAVIVWLFDESDVKKALVLGVSLPAFLNTLGGTVLNTGARPQTGTPEEERSARGLPVGAFSFLPTAFAQEPVSSAATAAPERSLEINIDGQPFAYRVEILGAQGQVLGPAFDVSQSDSLLVAKPLPKTVTAIRFTVGGQSTTKSFTGKDGYTVEVMLRGLSFTRKFDVAQVFGKIPDLVPTAISAAVHLRPKAPVGAQGWIYVGTMNGGRWDAEHTVQGTSVPAVGDTQQIIYSANLRDAAGSKNPPAYVVSVFQQVRFLAVTTKGNTTWAQVEVTA